MGSTRKHQSATRKSTLHRLKVPDGSALELSRFVRDRYLDSDDYQTREFTRRGITGLLITGGVPRDRADWCDVVESITGLEVNERSRAAAGLVLLETARGTYALSYGVGQHMLDPYYRDDEFGLEFATRCLDDAGVIKIRNQIMDGRGRVDEYSVSRGERIDDFGLERFAAVVRRICGTVSGLPLTFLQSGKVRQVRVECSQAAIKLPLATSMEQFLSDLGVIEDVCARPDPLPQLRFVSRVHTLDNRSRKAVDAQKILEAQLTDPDSPRLTIGVPDSCQEGYSSAQAFRVRRGTQTIELHELELRHLLQFVKDKPPGERLKGLGDLRVTMFSDDDFQTPAGVTTSGKEWLIADVPLGSDRLFYGNGKWFEVGAGFIETLEEELTNLFAQPQTVTLPRWTKGPLNSDGQDTHDEDWFNHKTAEQDGYLLFDKDTVRTAKFRGGGLEICDILGPDNQLICIKKAPATTAPLNHLFAQGVVAVETLRSDIAVRGKFLTQVAAHTPDHRMLNDFGTLRVVFGILLKDGRDIAVNSLFAFAQVSLLQAVRRLRAMNAEVEVIAIRR
ncbi:sporadically distributed protein, TIGR04141 family [Streptomyces sp. ScaeMP-e83]|nr:sporadically distributed protein, TIGR04141 family [Streptomyces sp. ScaeMP-e83]